MLIKTLKYDLQDCLNYNIRQDVRFAMRRILERNLQANINMHRNLRDEIDHNLRTSTLPKTLQGFP